MKLFQRIIRIFSQQIVYRTQQNAQNAVFMEEFADLLTTIGNSVNNL